MELLPLVVPYDEVDGWTQEAEVQGSATYQEFLGPEVLSFSDLLNS